MTSHRTLDHPGEPLRPDLVRRILTARYTLLRKMVAASEKLAQRLSPEILERAVERGRSLLEGEIRRLESLQQVNANVREEEIEHLRRELAAVTRRLESSGLRLDALRVIIAT